MIAFSCAHCGLKLQVKPEYSDRSSKCPSCKKLLTVPTLDRTQGGLPNEQIDGAPSSLDRAGVNAGVTLAADDAATGRTSVQELLTQQRKKGERYIVEGEIARGGMGVVLRAVDGDIRREVAVKFMLDQADAKKKIRFVEEAQITGQLEHPNIVPIHELGVDAEKRLFFSMKMVRGRNLAQVLDELRKNPGSAEKEYSLTRLLNILVGVCNALAYAHARGVVHRDLKPANIMLGDFGEVYVMDWGLAKVLGRTDEAPGAPTGSESQPAVVGRNSKVVTNREAEPDLTQDGAILGTPVYMPPEQALGKIGEIDRRSDVYSLGAILYEMLTLQPPVDKGGGHLAVLMRVSQGEVVPPEQRNPQRAKAGKIPKALAAVAMKALAPKKEDRYASTEALRQDVERFQEGRSVSARPDTSWELARKLIQRNKGASLGAAATVVVLVASLVFIFQAWRATSAAQEAVLREQAAKEQVQDEKRRQLVQSVPAFLGAARMWGENRNLDNALSQVNLALEYAPESPEARLLKSQVLVARKEFADAEAELDRYLSVRPDDADAKELRRLCRQAKPDDGERLLALSGVLLRQKALGLSDCLMQDVSKLVLSREKLLPVLRSRIEASWPGLGNRLKVSNDGRLTLHLYNCGSQVRDLSPLRDMPLEDLGLNSCVQVRDLTPLQGMPLTRLDLGGCEQVQDLTPLHDLKLTWLSLYGCVRVRDVTPLHGMPLTALNLFDCGQVRDLAPLQGMPLTSLNLDCCGRVVDLTPLQGMKLTSLSLPNQTTAKELAVLQGMPLTSLHGSFCNSLRDLKPLKGLRLKSLGLRACAEIHDLTPLEGMPLTSLDLIYCGKVKDLSPLGGLELQEICLTPRYITKGMDALRQMKSLKTITIDWDHKERLSPVEFWKKYDAGDFK